MQHLPRAGADLGGDAHGPARVQRGAPAGGLRADPHRHRHQHRNDDARNPWGGGPHGRFRDQRRGQPRREAGGLDEALQDAPARQRGHTQQAHAGRLPDAPD